MTTSYNLKKIPTAIEGLDDVLHGGFPKGRTTILRGGPGSGKSVLALEFIYRNALKNSPGLFIPFEESANLVRENARTVGWDLEPLEKNNQLFLYEPHLDPHTIVTGEFNLNGLLTLLHAKAQQMGATYIVFDALDVVLHFFDTQKAAHNEMFTLHQWIQKHGYTAIITVKTMTETLGGSYEFLDYMGDCVICIDQYFGEKFTTRQLRVIKYRGSSYGRTANPFVIKTGGIQVVPPLTYVPSKGFAAEKLSTGNHRIDTMLFGGFRRGSCVILSGAPGTGKTTLASTFARAASARKERVLYIGYEESAHTLISAMAGINIDLQKALDSGYLHLHNELPDAYSSEEQLVNILQLIRQINPEHVIVDAISSFERMGNLKSAYEFVVYLVTYCRSKGQTLILTNQTTNDENAFEISHFNISSLLDTVITLRYIRIGGETNRLISTIKARGSNHTNQAREFQITSQGIELADVYLGENGVLTGVARQEQEAREAFLKRQRLDELQRIEKDIEARRLSMKAQMLNMESEIAAMEAKYNFLQLEENVRSQNRITRGEMRGSETTKDSITNDSNNNDVSPFPQKG